MNEKPAAGADGGVVERYLAAIPAHDWDALAATLSPDVERVGPYNDVYRGREPYVAFLAGLVPTLRGYAMDVTEVRYWPDGRFAVATLSETVDVDGAPLVTDEVLLFRLDDDGRIARVEIFTRRRGG